MEYRYSNEIDPKVYESHGLSYDLPLRMHKEPARESKGALRAQRDWSKHVHPVNDYKGGLGDRYNFMSVTVPECLPERLEVISYANEYAFLYDDKMETFDLKGDLRDASGFLETFGNGALEDKAHSESLPEKKLQTQILSEMMAIDPPRAITSMKAWAKFVQLAAKTRSAPFETLEKYLPARAIDGGELIWFGTLTFGLALTIPDEEYDLCMELARPAYIALALVNDLYSWEKERKEAREAGQDYVFNAIWVVTKERSAGEDEARAVCHDEAVRQIATFHRTVEASRDDATLTKDLRTYLEALLLSYSGNFVWSIYCPRYKGGFC